MKKVAILQSNYVPWKGYFDLLASVDEFIIFDDMQYTRRDWRNRNKIKTPQGTAWMTIPVKVSGKYHQTIKETEIDDASWSGSHWNMIARNYRQAACFDEVADWVRPIYEQSSQRFLYEVNRSFIDAICRYLGIRTVLRNCWDYELVEGKNERLISLCEQAGADVYVSGPAARDYIDEQAFRDRGLSVSWFDYNGYPEYNQFWGPFVHDVSILDLLFHCGGDSRKFMKHVSSEPTSGIRP